MHRVFALLKTQWGNGRSWVTFMRAAVMASVCVFSGCGTAPEQHSVTSQGFRFDLQPQIFKFADGGQTTYYDIQIGQPYPAQPVLIILGGAGCARGSEALRAFLDGINQPVKVWMMEKRGVQNTLLGNSAARQTSDCTAEYHEHAYAVRIVDDQIEFIRNRLKTLATQALRPVILLGISEGGMIAPAVAQSLLEVTHVAMVSAGGMSLRDELAVLVKKHREAIDVPTIVNAIRNNSSDAQTLLWGNSVRWWGSFLDYSSIPYVTQLRQPFLVAFGGQDTSVPVESGFFLRSHAMRIGKKNLTLMIYPEANHYLVDQQWDYRPDFLATLLRWVRTGQASPSRARIYANTP